MQLVVLPFLHLDVSFWLVSDWQKNLFLADLILATKILQLFSVQDALVHIF